MRRYRRKRKPLGILQQILTEVKKLRRQVSRMDARITKLIADFDTETNAIAARIDALIAQGSAANPDEIVAALQPISDRLKTLASDPANPIPPADV